MEINKKNIAFMVIGAITLIAVTLGATYAYFTAQSGGGANIDTDVITGTTDNLSFSFGDLISIYATEENFGQGMGSISDSTTGTAMLKANNTTNEATATYNIYLIIEANDFVYTTENQTPEILLNVTDPNGNKVENITGLVHYENGFDITTRTGGFLLVPDYEISATVAQTIQDWNIEVTLVNLDSDQNANTNKTLTGKIYMTQDKMSSYELTEINNIETTTTYNSINATLDLTSGSAAVSKYYYGIEKTSEALAYNDSVSLKRLSNTLASANDVEYIESDNPNYKFSNLEANTEYTIYSYVLDENKIKSNVYETTVETGIFVAPMINTVVHSSALNSIFLTVNATPGSNEIVKYMYSKDNGASWEESTSNTHTFDGLTDSTEYKIKVKAIDSEGNESTEYYTAITTEIYILPVISSVNATTTWNSITLTPTGTNGTNMISKYMYSINDGSYQESNIFDNLNEQTNYIIKVKAIDTNNRESNEYQVEVTTDAYKLPTINNVTISRTSNSITLNVSATSGDGSIVSYHYSKDDGSNYTESNSANYTFNDLTSNTTYYLKVYATDSNSRISSIYNITTSTLIENLSDVCSNGSNLSDCIKTYYNTYGESYGGLYLHDGVGTYTNADQEAGDGSYRYAGANPNNYVCFGSEEEICSEENLYRIIGVFDGQVKLIKAVAYGYYYWSGTSSVQSNNIWSESTLNTTILNSTYYNSFVNNWQSKIATTTWYLGGYETSIDVLTKNFYDAERSGITYNAKIGLMYVSDYGYATTPENWIIDLYNYHTDTVLSNNWLYLGYDDWTITRSSVDQVGVYHVDWSGALHYDYVYDRLDAVRPVFYLNSDVSYVSGDGSINNPYRIA